MALAIHSSTPALATAAPASNSIVSNSFSPPSNSVIFLSITADGVATSAQSVSSVTDNLSSHLSWTLLARDNVNAASTLGGTAEVWYAPCALAQTNMTVTANFAHPTPSTTGTVDCAILPIVVTGAATTQLGATARHNSSAAGTPSLTLATNFANSYVLGVTQVWNNATAPTVPSGQTITVNGNSTLAQNSSDVEEFWTQITTATQGNQGTSVTINDTTPTGVVFNMVAVEVVASNEIGIAAGFPVSNTGTAISTLAVTTQNIGDRIVLFNWYTSTAFHINSLTGGGVTWDSIATGTDVDTTNGISIECWQGTVSTVGAGTITVNYSGSNAGINIAIEAYELVSGFGTTTAWATTATNKLTAQSATVSPFTMNFPSITSGTVPSQAYLGFDIMNTGANAGSTTGFTYTSIGFQAGNGISCFNGALSTNTAYQPTCTETGTGGFYDSLGVIISATSGIAVAPNFPVSALGTGQSTVAVTTVNVNDRMVLFVRYGATTAWHVNSVAGGGCSWAASAAAICTDSTNGFTIECWLGTVTSVVNGFNITASYSAATAGNILLQAYELTAPIASPIWSTVATGSLAAQTGATENFPSLTSGTLAIQAYLGHSVQANTGQVGSTSGFTYTAISSGTAGVSVFNGALATSTAYQPTASQNVSGWYDSLGVILAASTTAGSPKTSAQTTKARARTGISTTQVPKARLQSRNLTTVPSKGRLSLKPTLVQFTHAYVTSKGQLITQEQLRGRLRVVRLTTQTAHGYVQTTSNSFDGTTFDGGLFDGAFTTVTNTFDGSTFDSTTFDGSTPGFSVVIQTKARVQTNNTNIVGTSGTFGSGTFGTGTFGSGGISTQNFRQPVAAHITVITTPHAGQQLVAHAFIKPGTSNIQGIKGRVNATTQSILIPKARVRLPLSTQLRAHATVAMGSPHPNTSIRAHAFVKLSTYLLQPSVASVRVSPRLLLSTRGRVQLRGTTKTEAVNSRIGIRPRSPITIRSFAVPPWYNIHGLKTRIASRVTAAQPTRCTIAFTSFEFSGQTNDSVATNDSSNLSNRFYPAVIVQSVDAGHGFETSVFIPLITYLISAPKQIFIPTAVSQLINPLPAPILSEAQFGPPGDPSPTSWWRISPRGTLTALRPPVPGPGTTQATVRLNAKVGDTSISVQFLTGALIPGTILYLGQMAAAIVNVAAKANDLVIFVQSLTVPLTVGNVLTTTPGFTQPASPGAPGYSGPPPPGAPPPGSPLVNLRQVSIVLPPPVINIQTGLPVNPYKAPPTAT